jgi:hypothetical protein
LVGAKIAFFLYALALNQKKLVFLIIRDKNRV